MPPPPLFAAFAQLNLIDGLDRLLIGGVVRVGHVPGGLTKPNQFGVSHFLNPLPEIPHIEL